MIAPSDHVTFNQSAEAGSKQMSNDIIHDHDTRLSAHDLIMVRNGYADYIETDQCTNKEKQKILKEIYYTDLLIEVRTIQAFRMMGAENN